MKLCVTNTLIWIWNWLIFILLLLLLLFYLVSVEVPDSTMTPNMDETIAYEDSYPNSEDSDDSDATVVFEEVSSDNDSDNNIF